MKNFRRFLFLSVFFIPTLGWSLTLTTILTRIRQNIRDTSTVTTDNSQRYTDATLTTYVNEAQKEINTLTWAVEKSTSYVLAAGTTYYSLPTDFLAPTQVLFTDASSTTIILAPVTEQIVYQVSPNFEQSSTGSPFQYFTRFPGSGTALQIAYIPIPTTTSTGTVKVSYNYQPADLSAGSDIPFDGFVHLYPYHESIVVRVSAMIMTLEGRDDRASAFMQTFANYIAEMEDKNMAKPNYLPSARGAPR